MGVSGEGRFGLSQTTSAKLAEELERAIIHGEYPLGTSLPSERDLMVDFDVSRTTVREALRILAADGLIAVRRGRKGGSFVSGPSHEAASRSLNLLMNDSKFRFVDLLAAREAIEPVAAAQAAQYRNQVDIEILSNLSQQCDDCVDSIEAFVEVNFRWHMAVVDASKNPLFKAFMESIASPVRDATDLDVFDLSARKSVAQAHRRVFQAIEAGDAKAAKRRMMRHIAAYVEELSNANMPVQEGVPSPVRKKGHATSSDR